MCIWNHNSELNKRGKCKQCALNAVMRYYWKNREKQLQKMRLYGKTSKKTKIRNKEYRTKNRDKRAEQSKEWHAKNKDRASKYRIDRSNIYAVHARNRRARIKNIGGSHSVEDIYKILSNQKNKCAGCLNILDKYHVDHIVPIALGGSNDKFNLQILCPACNLSKNRKDPILWAKQNGRLL